MTAPEYTAKRPGHTWTRWAYNRARRRWYRHCTIGGGNCTAIESAGRGQKPKGQR